MSTSQNLTSYTIQQHRVLKCHEGRVQVHLFSTLFHQDIIIISAGTNEKVLDLMFT